MTSFFLPLRYLGVILQKINLNDCELFMKNKIRFIVCILALFMCPNLRAENGEIINLGHKGNNGTHFLLPNLNEVPTIVYYNNEQLLEIDGSGAVSYYEVTITSATTSLTFLYTVVDGDYDTIDISYLPAGDTYVITLTTPGGNEYEGTIAL